MYLSESDQVTENEDDILHSDNDIFGRGEVDYEYNSFVDSLVWKQKVCKWLVTI